MRGFPNRMMYPDFKLRYACLAAAEIASSSDNKIAFDRERYRLGHTLVFFRAGALAGLEEARDGFVIKWLRFLQGEIFKRVRTRVYEKRRDQRELIKVAQRKLDKNDLRGAFDNVGVLMSEGELDGLLGEIGGACTYDNMVKMFQEKMAGEGNDSDDLIVQAFKAYDQEGKIDSKMFTHALMTWGDEMTKAEIDDIFGEFEIDEDYMLKSKDVIGLFVAVKEEPKKEEEAPAPVEEAPADEDEGDAKKKKKKKKKAAK